ncbi:MAG: acyltransferase [Pseudomonadota bacterium]
MRFYLIDALRGIAAMWVVLFHAYEGRHIDKLADWLPIYLEHLLFKIEAGVPIFFVLSGFVIAHSMNRDIVNGSYMVKFAFRRSIRLDPPYWGSIILFLFVAWLSSTVKAEPMDWPDINTIIAHMFYTQGLLGLEHINKVYWTLCLEIQFYIVFCLVLFLLHHIEKFFKSGFLAVFFLIAIISLLWPTKIISDNLLPGLFLPHWHAFLLGVFAYWSWQKKIPVYYFYIYSTILLVTVYSSGSEFTLVSAVTALLLHECANFGYIASANWRWIQFLGRISYSLYLTHNPITGASYFIIYRLFGNSLIIQGFAFVITIIACVAFAFIFWWMFERWSIQLSKKVILHKATNKL